MLDLSDERLDFCRVPDIDRFRDDLCTPLATIAAVSITAALFKSQTATFAPSFANAKAIPRPMPSPAPVTIATFSLSCSWQETGLSHSHCLRAIAVCGGIARRYQ